VTFALSFVVVLSRRGGTVSSHKKFGVCRGSEQVLKEAGINCWEVPRDKLPLTVVSDL
jgi:hypothetical protein